MINKILFGQKDFGTRAARVDFARMANGHVILELRHVRIGEITIGLRAWNSWRHARVHGPMFLVSQNAEEAFLAEFTPVNDHIRVFSSPENEKKTIIPYETFEKIKNKFLKNYSTSKIKTKTL